MNVERLASIASAYEPSLSALAESAITLTPYATFYRYPGESESMEPTRKEFDEALSCAERFVARIFSLIPDDLKPGDA